jgi:acid stress-induced BolA-like protein IbaG/YrbA
MAEPTPQEIHADIAAGLVCSHLAVDGDGRHFQATIVSPAFEGLSRIKRHQAVYAVLGNQMRAHIHALSMKTLTPAEWAASPGGEGVGANVATSQAPHHLH